jgi:hypothetical protein
MFGVSQRNCELTEHGAVLVGENVVLRYVYSFTLLEDVLMTKLQYSPTSTTWICYNIFHSEVGDDISD